MEKNKKTSQDLSPAEQELLLRKLEQEKRLIMWTGVTFFMVLFIAFWFISFNSAVNEQVVNSKSGPSLNDVLNKFKNDFVTTKSRLDAAAEQAKSLATTTEIVSSTSREVKLDNLNVGIDQKKLQQLKNSIESQINATTSTNTTGLPVSK